MLQHNNLRDSADEKTAESTDPSVPERAEQCWQTEAHQNRNQMNMSMLPHHERIFLEIGHIIERRLRPKFEQKPANVRMKKPFGDVVGVLVMVDVFMVAAVIARPHQNRIFKCASAKDKCEKPDRQACLESNEIGRAHV